MPSEGLFHLGKNNSASWIVAVPYVRKVRVHFYIIRSLPAPILLRRSQAYFFTCALNADIFRCCHLEYSSTEVNTRCDNWRCDCLFFFLAGKCCRSGIKSLWHLTISSSQISNSQNDQSDLLCLRTSLRWNRYRGSCSLTICVCCFLHG